MSPDDAPRSCQVCGAKRDLERAGAVRPAIAEQVARSAGHWDEHGWICRADLARFRSDYVRSLLTDELGEVSELERQVIESLHEQEILARNPVALEGRLPLGQRVADRIADFGGSWTFLGIFASILVVWMAVNSGALLARPFDPYPYILLNLVLSCIAAVQAPVIMMSQNRQEDRDRRQSAHDYQVNLKAELEIRHLHQKLDHLMSHQWERLVEIQEIQMELIGELKANRR